MEQRASTLRRQTFSQATRGRDWTACRDPDSEETTWLDHFRSGMVKINEQAWLCQLARRSPETSCQRLANSPMWEECKEDRCYEGAVRVVFGSSTENTTYSGRSLQERSSQKSRTRAQGLRQQLLGRFFGAAVRTGVSGGPGRQPGRGHGGSPGPCWCVGSSVLAALIVFGVC